MRFGASALPNPRGAFDDSFESSRISRAVASPTTRFVLRAIVAAVLLVLVLSRANVAELRFPGGVRVVGAVGAAAGMLAVALVLSAVRWWLVVGPGRAPLGFLVRLYFVGQFFSLFLPTSVGGDAVRVLALSRAVGGMGRALSSVIIERLLGICALVAYLLMGGLLTPSLLTAFARRLTWRLGWEHALLLAAALGIACALAVFYGMRSIKLRQLWRDASDAWARFRHAPWPLTTAVLTSLVVQATYILVWYVLARIVHLDVPLSALLVFVPLVSLVAMLPVTLSGLGVREGAWTLLLQPLGITSANAIGFSLLFYVANLLTGAVGAGIYMVHGAAVGRPIAHAA